MAKREFAHPNEMHKYVGQEIGVSDWVEVTQEQDQPVRRGDG